MGFKSDKELIQATETWDSDKLHKLWCYTSTKYAQDQLAVLLCIGQFKKSGSKKQADLINNWFICKDEDSKIPDALSETGFLTIANMKGTDSASIHKTVEDSISKIRTATSTRSKFARLSHKLQKLTYMKLETSMFNDAQGPCAAMLMDGGGANCGAFEEKKTYQFNGSFAKLVDGFRRELKVQKFDADAMGIYI